VPVQFPQQFRISIVLGPMSDGAAATDVLTYAEAGLQIESSSARLNL
jgi:hypothetical protein